MIMANIITLTSREVYWNCIYILSLSCFAYLRSSRTSITARKFISTLQSLYVLWNHHVGLHYKNNSRFRNITTWYRTYVCLQYNSGTHRCKKEMPNIPARARVDISLITHTALAAPPYTTRQFLQDGGEYVLLEIANNLRISWTRLEWRGPNWTQGSIKCTLFAMRLEVRV